MRSCSGSCLKLFVFLFNFLFVLFSILIMVFAGLSIANVFEYKHVYHISNAPFGVLIGVGALLFLLTFMGCCGAFMENTCMLMGFSYTVGALVLVQIAAVAVAYRYRSKVEDYIKDEAAKVIKDYDDNKDVTTFLDRIQSDMKCCGIKGKEDWKDYTKEHGGKYPNSCCPSEDKDKCFDAKAFTNSCSKPIENAIKNNIGITIGVVCGFIGIQFFSMVASCLLVASIRKDYFSFV